MTFYKKLLAVTFLTTLVALGDNKKQEFLYDQLLPKIITLDIENPTEEALNEINLGQAYLQGGTKVTIASSEVWQAICSIDIFTILKQYMAPYTVSGKIALGRFACLMNDNLSTLKNKIAIQKYFQNSPSVYNKLDKILSSAAPYEKAYGDLFKAQTEDDKALVEKEESQLYFSSTYGLDAFNENEYALGVGPRLNQLFTTTSYAIPPILASVLYHQVKLGHQITQAQEQLKFIADSDVTSYDEYQKALNKVKNELEKQSKALEKTAKNEPDQARIIKIALWFKKTKISTLDISSDEFKEILKTKDEFLKSEFYTKAKEKYNKEVSIPYKGYISRYYSFEESPEYKEGFNNFFGKKHNLGKESLTLCDNPDDMNARFKDGISFTDQLHMLARGLYKGITNLPKTLYDGTSIAYSFTKEELTNGSYIYNPIAEKHAFKNDSNFSFYAKVGGTYSIALGYLSAYPMFLYSRYYKTKTLFDLIYKKQEELHNVAQLIVTLENLYSALQEDSDLQKILADDVRLLSELFNPKSNVTSNDLKVLIEKLNSSSFVKDPSYFISQPGKILATHKLLKRIKHELAPYLEVLGNVDAYLAIHRTYFNFEHHPRVKFCLPEFIAHPTPIFDIANYWHPLIDPNVVVTNSLSMGTGTIKNLMITGPNAGGKTTSLMSLIINIIFAQSFGIAPSEKLVLTPFAKIHSYLDITTNLQEGLSLFAAEVDRAKKLKNSILSCTGNQKTFSIIDEIFSGTAPDVASDIGSKFATQLGEVAHSMTIITTHFPALTKVGQETGTFTNYKVADATIMPNGKIVYPFKLVPGVSSQNIAQHMLEQENII